MPKRYTDTEKWKKPFIRGLQAPYKLLWFYILDDCDHAGIWHVEIDVAALRICEEIDIEDAKKQFKSHIIEFAKGTKWFIPDFVEFQYGKLNPENRVHNSVIRKLKKYKLLNLKEHISPLQGAKDKDKDKDKDLLKEKEKKFKKELELFLEKYSKEILNEFYTYWTEPNKSGTKLRWEMEKTWDIKRRLSRWASNKFNIKKTEEKTTYNRKELLDNPWES